MKIAIVGTGISGLIAAYLLNQNHEITVFEKNDYVGGHSNTKTIDYNNKKISVDTGFIVYNERNYPNLTALFKELNVKTDNSNMSFSVSLGGGKLEYAGTSLRTVFAQTKNLLNPFFIRMTLDILKFNKNALSIIEENRDISLGDYLKELHMSDSFKKWYLLPMGGAIWSCPLEQMLAFPAKTFVRFFKNHGLLTVNDHPQWKTVSGGSKNYVKEIIKSFESKIKLNTRITCIHRKDGKVELEDGQGNKTMFDHVVLAAHGDQSLRILKDASPLEKEILGNFKYQKNKAILHRDKNLMPKRKKVWASWNYIAEKDIICNEMLSLTYWMNKLQNIDNEFPLFVSLNPSLPIKEELIFDEIEYEHPVFDVRAIKAQERISEIQGKNNTWFAGAWMGYGFHEDGLKAGLEVANSLGSKAKWQ